MNEESSRILSLPLFGGIAIGLVLLAGFAKVRFDRLENLVGAVDEGTDVSTYEEPELERVYETPQISFQEVYVPVDTHVVSPTGALRELHAALSLRNTSETHPLYVRSLDHYDKSGKRVRRYTQETFAIAPFASLEFLAQETACNDKKPMKGGDSVKEEKAVPLSHFVVAWGNTPGASAPIIESTMTDTQGRLSHFRPSSPLRHGKFSPPPPRSALPRRTPPAHRVPGRRDRSAARNQSQRLYALG
jgi:hypothetical protein